MTTKLDVNVGTTDVGKKIWSIHQKNEYTKVNNYKEAMCFGCFTKDVAAALVSDICGDCASKKGRETLLVSIKPVIYGLCHFCGIYKFNMEQMNIRLCFNCHRRVANNMKNFNKQGGMFNVDPFWKKMRIKHGKDWQHQFNNNTGNNR
jgi:hypothetical protein